MTPPYRSDFWIINVPIAPGRHSCAAGRRSPNYPGHGASEQTTASRLLPEQPTGPSAGHPWVWWSKSFDFVGREFEQIDHFDFRYCILSAFMNVLRFFGCLMMSYGTFWDISWYLSHYLGDLFGFVRFRVLTSRTTGQRGWKWRRYEYWSEKERKRTEHEYLIHLNPRIHTPQSSQPGRGWSLY